MKRVRYSWIVPQWLGQLRLTSTSTASRLGRMRGRLGADLPVEGVGQAVGRVGRDDERAVAELRRADRGGGGEARLADAALARVEDEPRAHRDAAVAPRAARARRAKTSSPNSARPRRSWTSCSSSGTSTGRSRVSTSSRATARRSTAGQHLLLAQRLGEARGQLGGDAGRVARRRERDLAGGVGVHAVHDERRRRASPSPSSRRWK